MPGVPGRSGGHNRRSVEAHLMSGTYRKGRHGAIPGARGNLAVLPAHTRTGDERAARRRLLAGLSRPQQALGRRLLAEYDGWGEVDRVLFRLALEALDRCDECRTQVQKDGLVSNGRAHPLARVERQSAQFAAAAFRQLGIGGGK